MSLLQHIFLLLFVVPLAAEIMNQYKDNTRLGKLNNYFIQIVTWSVSTLYSLVGPEVVTIIVIINIIGVVIKHVLLLVILKFILFYQKWFDELPSDSLARKYSCPNV